MKHKIKNIKTVSHEEVLNRFVGEPDTKNRVRFENELKAEILAHQFKELRKKKHLTQSQLAEKLGMGKGQISKIENGKFNLTIATINKIVSALDAKVSFNLQIVIS
jgi:HTH-type transcriptional regulator / antitoxin HipB